MKNGYFAALVLLMGLAIPAGAHTGDRVFPIPELTDEMLEEIRLDDGSIDEWYDLVGEPTMTLLDFQDPDGNRLPEPSKLDFRIWLAWHDDPDRLYVAFVSSDDEYSNSHDYDGKSRLLEHDSIALAIDGDHRGGHGGVDISAADVFLDGLLMPANPTDPAEATAVESVTWGRIKAALEVE